MSDLLWSQQLLGTVEFAVVFHIWEGQASAIVWGLLSLTLSKENRNLRPCNTRGQSVNQGEKFAMRRRRQAIHLVWKEFAMSKTSPQTYITGSTWLLTDPDHVYNLDTFEHFVFQLRYYFLISCLSSFLPSFHRKLMLKTQFHNFLICSDQGEKKRPKVCLYRRHFSHVFQFSISCASDRTNTVLLYSIQLSTHAA